MTLDIEPGDTVTTIYSGPYLVTRVSPQDDGTISLTCRSTVIPLHRIVDSNGEERWIPSGTPTRQRFYINGIHLVDGRWMQYGDPLLVQKAERQSPRQLRLF